jgi:hypothetical protein
LPQLLLAMVVVVVLIPHNLFWPLFFLEPDGHTPLKPIALFGLQQNQMRTSKGHGVLL